jgi:hypothetical protein
VAATSRGRLEYLKEVGSVVETPNNALKSSGLLYDDRNRDFSTLRSSPGFIIIVGEMKRSELCSGSLRALALQ